MANGCTGLRHRCSEWRKVTAAQHDAARQRTAAPRNADGRAGTEVFHDFSRLGRSVNQSALDIVSVCTFLAALLFAPAVAAVVGPYIVILLASTIGASFALARRPSSTRWDALRFFLRTNGLAVLLTVAAAALANTIRPELNERVLLAPIAFVLGLIGDDWPRIATWAGGKLNSLVDNLIKLRGGGGGG